jgi:2-phospho-L-lactate/phosphoenolpyruvate guanylyltransferase
MQVHVVIPLKSAADGKSRLASALTEAQRAALIRVMAAHVVEAVSATRGVHRVHLLAREPDLAPRGCAPIADRGTGLNAAIADAARALREQGAGRMLIVHADLPFVTPDEIGALVHACATEDALVAAPDTADAGTNALGMPLSCKVATRFGPQSLEAHRLAAAAAQLPFRVVRRPGLACDIDEPTQLEMLLERGGAPYAFLRPALRARAVPRTRAAPEQRPKTPD